MASNTRSRKNRSESEVSESERALQATYAEINRISENTSTFTTAVGTIPRGRLLERSPVRKHVARLTQSVPLESESAQPSTQMETIESGKALLFTNTVCSRRSTKSTSARVKLLEYEAAKRLAAIESNLIKKKLEADILALRVKNASNVNDKETLRRRCDLSNATMNEPDVSLPHATEVRGEERERHKGNGIRNVTHVSEKMIHSRPPPLKEADHPPYDGSVERKLTPHPVSKRADHEATDGQEIACDNEGSVLKEFLTTEADILQCSTHPSRHGASGSLKRERPKMKRTVTTNEGVLTARERVREEQCFTHPGRHDASGSLKRERSKTKRIVTTNKEVLIARERMREEQSNTCFRCMSASHHTPLCPQLRKLATNEVWKWAKEQRLCFKCMKRKHSRKVCNAKLCGIDGCKMSHHAILHIKAAETQVKMVKSCANQSAPAAVMNVAMMKMPRIVLMKPYKLKLNDPRGEVITDTFLDKDYKVTLANKSLASKVDNERKVIETVRYVMRIQEKVSFNIRRRNSNSTKLLMSILEAKHSKNVDVRLTTHAIMKTLGLKWNSRDGIRNALEAVKCHHRVPSQWEALSAVISTLDSLGLVYQYTVVSNVIPQRLLLKKERPDEKLSGNEAEESQQWVASLGDISAVALPRYYSVEMAVGWEIQLHVFNDASEQAFGTIAYWKSRHNEGTVEIVQVMGKTKVAPLTLLTKPRLELQAAVIETLESSVIVEKHLREKSKVMCWTDSNKVLYRIRDEHKEYTPFVVHRIAELSHRDDWRWVPTHDNVADDATRIGTRRIHKTDRWFTGPSFLKEPEENWPSMTPDCERSDKVVYSTAELRTRGDVTLLDIRRFSSYKRLIRATATVCFLKEKRRDIPVQAVLVNNAEAKCIRQSQRDSIGNYMIRLKTKRKDSKLAKIDPVIQDGIIKARRRIGASKVTTQSNRRLIMKLRRMAARRGWPQVIISNNATNQEADDRLRKSHRIWISELRGYYLNYNTKWRFITPGVPHMGGARERIVRSVKAALSTTPKEKSAKEEVLTTLLTEAEYSVNARPLTHVPVKHEEEEALTPNRFLMGSSTDLPRTGPCTEADRSVWRRSQAMADQFRKRWLKEYLPTLIPRGQAKTEVPQLQPNDLVMIVDGALPRNTWPRGVIERVHPGPDGVVRAADVRTKGGVFRRPATKIAVLLRK